MKHLLIDANNIASLSFFRAKSIMMKEINSKIDIDNEKELITEVQKNIIGFSTHMFFNKLHSIMKLNKGAKVYIIWDGKGGSNWRKKINSDYKANRKHGNDSFYPVYINMMNKSKEILKSYPVVQFTKQEAEADDLIYSIVKYVSNNVESEVATNKLIDKSYINVVSTDTDMIQLAQQFSNVDIYNPITKKNQVIPEYNYVLYKSIVGDKSDNIVGVPRYGKKKGANAAIAGIDSMKEEFHPLIKNNLLIIDMAQNPNQKDNYSYISEIIKGTKITLDIDKIKKHYFDLKLKSLLDGLDTTSKLLKNLL